MNKRLTIDTKQPADLGPELDLQEHRRLITRALVQSAARRVERMAALADSMAACQRKEHRLAIMAVVVER
jgi:hypothetical protein